MKERDWMAVEQSLTMREIMYQVCTKHGVTPLELKSKRRHKRYALARFEFYWRCREETAASFPEIGIICGYRDHTTVMSGARRYAEIHGIQHADA